MHGFYITDYMETDRIRDRPQGKHAREGGGLPDADYDDYHEVQTAGAVLHVRGTGRGRAQQESCRHSSFVSDRKGGDLESRNERVTVRGLTARD